MATEQNKYESLLSRVAELKERFNSGSFFKYWELCGRISQDFHCE